MALEFRAGGRRVNQKQLFDGIKKKAVDMALAAMEEKYHGVAASIIDPATGKHADVFVRRTNHNNIAISTSGSPAYARELERRLGLREGEVKAQSDQEMGVTPRVYLAHASEDHETLARPLAERLLGKGVDVWLDDWEIGSGDSLRQKMESGLNDCTHFVVLLTPESIRKAWVNREIDVGFLRLVKGQSRFLGLRVGVEVSDLSAFLQTVRCPAVRLDDDSEIESLVADIHGATKKPPLGDKPHYVRSKPAGLPGWSSSAAIVAEYLVRHSEHGRRFDPEVSPAKVAEAAGLPLKEVELGVLDLVDAGLIELTDIIGSDDFWPKEALFVEFDRHFMGFDNRDDAVAVANRLISEELEGIAVSELAKRFPDWPPRRLNSALSYLEGMKAITTHSYLDNGPWTVSELDVTARTLRFVRDHG
ncbi:MAG: toll/interleukin-1 receptor domain-containing protein [Glycocaulis sp.]